MTHYLVGYDYGMGGHWFYIEAARREDILDRYPHVGIWSNPTFFDKEYLEQIKREDTYRLGAVPSLINEVLLEAEKYNSSKTPPNN